MGETTCLMQPFSYTAGIPNEAKEGNPIHALGQSVSFGRFMSESLSWEKWSTFSHNRYVEEAEKFARPGSVAQMKAFFEAHYKNLAAKKAAALLEQKNAATNNTLPEPEPEHEGGSNEDTAHYKNLAAKKAAALLEQKNAATNNTLPEPEPEHEVGSNEDTAQDPQTVTVNTNLPVERQEDVKEVNTEATLVAADDNGHGPNSKAEMDKVECGVKEEGNGPVTKNQVAVENSAQDVSLSCVDVDVPDSSEEVKEMELSENKQMEKPLLKDFIANKEDFAPAKKKKPAVSSSRSLIFGRATNKPPSSPAKPAASLHARKENNTTPICKKTPKSTYKSMSFTPVRELNKITSTIIRKIDNSRANSSSKVANKDFCSTPLRTPTTVSRLADLKHHFATPQSENRREGTPLHPSASGGKTARAKWHFLPTDCSNFMSSCKSKLQSPGVSTPFSFRTEERAARRKEKLEEKFNANQAHQVQLQASLKKKAESELKKLRQTLCFKARPLPDFYKERSSKNQIEKVPLTHSKSPELGQKPTPSVTQNTSKLPQKSSIKNDDPKHIKGKKSQNQRSRENNCPNIQHP